MEGRIKTLEGTGERLTFIMKRCGVSRKHLAAISGLSYPTIKRMCEGSANGSIASWLAVADALDVHVSELLDAAKVDE